MVMNKDTRYGRGDFTFNMNIGWFANMIYEQGGEGWTERDDNDGDKVYEFYTRMETAIGDYIDGIMNADGSVEEEDIYYHIMENALHPEYRKDVEEFYYTEDSDMEPTPRPSQVKADILAKIENSN